MQFQNHKDTFTFRYWYSMVKVKRRVQTVVNYWRRMLFGEKDHWLMRELMHGKPLRTDARFIRKRMMQVKQNLNTYLILHLLKQPWYVFLALLLVHFVRGDILTVDELPLLSSEVDGGSSASPKRLRVVFSGFQMQEGQTWALKLSGGGNCYREQTG